MKKQQLPGGLEVFHLNRGETVFLHEEIFERRSYMQHGIVVGPGACVFDVGANIGMFGIFLARLDPGVRVFAFEPVPPVCAVLRANMELHRVDARVFECALGSSAGELSFTYYPRNSLMSGAHADPAEDRRITLRYMQLKEEEAARAAGRPPRQPGNVDVLLDGLFQEETFRVPVRTLSDVIAEHGVERIDLLKIDVEKAEHEVLAGISGEDWDKVHQVVVEVHDRDGRLESVRRGLGDRGFELATEQDSLMRGTEVRVVYARRDISPAR